MSKILANIVNAQWMIEPSALEEIISIANREKSDIEKALKIQDDRKSELFSNHDGSMNDYGTLIRDDGVAIVSYHGPSMRYASLFTRVSGMLSYEALSDEIKSLAEDDKVTDIILDFDSPGGVVNGVSGLADTINTYKKKKPIYAHVSNAAFSAAYWIASQCTSINLSSTGSVGSIGVILKATKNKKEDGQEEYVIRSKNAFNKAPDVGTEGFMRQMQEHIDEIETVFYQYVASGRGLTEEFVLENFGNGGIFLGEKAVAIKIADSISDINEFINSIKSEVSVSGNSNKNKPSANEEETISLSEHEVKLEEAKKQGVIEGKNAEKMRIKSVMACEGADKVPDLVNQICFDDGFATLGEDQAKTIISSAAKAIPDAPKKEREVTGNTLNDKMREPGNNPNLSSGAENETDNLPKEDTEEEKSRENIAGFVSGLGRSGKTKGVTFNNQRYKG